MTETIVEALEKLRAVAAYNDPKLDFVKAYVYDLGINDLVKYGADQYVVRLEIPLFQMFILLSWSGPTLRERKLSSVTGVWFPTVAMFPS